MLVRLLLLALLGTAAARAQSPFAAVLQAEREAFGPLDTLRFAYTLLNPTDRDLTITSSSNPPIELNLRQDDAREHGRSIVTMDRQDFLVPAFGGYAWTVSFYPGRTRVPVREGTVEVFGWEGGGSAYRDLSLGRMLDVEAVPAPFTRVGVTMREPYRLGDVEGLRLALGAEWLPDAEQALSVQKWVYDGYRETGYVPDSISYETWRVQQDGAAWRIPLPVGEAMAVLEGDPRVRTACVPASPRIEDGPVVPPLPPYASPVHEPDRSRPARLVWFRLPVPPRDASGRKARYADRVQHARVALFDRFGRERQVLFDERTGYGERFVLDSHDLGPDLHFVRVQGETFGQTIPVRFGR